MSYKKLKKTALSCWIPDHLFYACKNLKLKFIHITELLTYFKII